MNSTSSPLISLTGPCNARGILMKTKSGVLAVMSIWSTYSEWAVLWKTSAWHRKSL